jgi:hypothetical protein
MAAHLNAYSSLKFTFSSYVEKTCPTEMGITRVLANIKKSNWNRTGRAFK